MYRHKKRLVGSCNMMVTSPSHDSDRQIITQNQNKNEYVDTRVRGEKA